MVCGWDHWVQLLTTGCQTLEFQTGIRLRHHQSVRSSSGRFVPEFQSTENITMGVLLPITALLFVVFFCSSNLFKITWHSTDGIPTTSVTISGLPR